MEGVLGEGRKEELLLCKDVAARGLDIPVVEKIVQFEPPSSSGDVPHCR
jgi:superfamily II DNA/RNA helicase